jgi:hypothetical protein
VRSLAQGSRYEFKYVIDEPRAHAVRDFARGYLKPDKYADPARNNSYPVYSLYLDSPAMDLCRATLHGHRNRIKLRIRFYDEVAEHPVYFEIKRRDNDVILKERAAVRRESIQPLLAGQCPSMRDLLAPGAGALAALHRFWEHQSALGAVGQAFVSYLREAYAGPDERIRLTFDREVAAARYRDAFRLPPAREWVHPPIGGVILEMKFTDRFPAWMRVMAEALDLERGRMAKYVSCVEPGGPLQTFLAYEF